MKIVVADDEQILLMYLEKLISDLLPDAEIFSFSNTKAVLESAKENKFDIAFLDINMPGITGIKLAKELKNLNNKINLIFITGYDGYQSEAMEMFASGYIKKPATKEKIKNQLDNLRYPIEAQRKRIFAKTFGNFTLFIDGTPITFARSKTQELLAYLIHNQGSFVSKKELSCIIFEDGIYDSNRMSYMSKLYSDLQNVLKSHDAENLIISSTKGLAICKDMLDCDLFDYLKGSEEAKLQYMGEYMNQYSWSEDMKAFFNKN